MARIGTGWERNGLHDALRPGDRRSGLFGNGTLTRPLLNCTALYDRQSQSPAWCRASDDFWRELSVVFSVAERALG